MQHPLGLRAGAQLHGFDIRLQSAAPIQYASSSRKGIRRRSEYAGFLMNELGIPAGSSGDFFAHRPLWVFRGSTWFVRSHVVSVSNGEKRDYAIQHVEVMNTDVDGGTLTFLPTVDVAGSVRVEGGAFSGFEKLRINLPAAKSVVRYRKHHRRGKSGWLVRC